MCSVFSFSLFFSLPLILTLVTASFSHFFTPAINFSCFFFSNKIGLLCFLSLALALALSLLKFGCFEATERTLRTRLRNQIFLPMVLR